MEGAPGEGWHYLRDGQTYGPVPEKSIRAWLESGFLRADDLLWKPGMAEWLPVFQIPELGGSPGSRDAAPAPGIPFGPPSMGGSASGAMVVPAGFWLRLGAYLIDSLLLSIILLIVWLPKIQAGIDPMELTKDRTLLLVSFLLSLVYYSLAESSVLQATLGKRAFRIKVVDLQGNRLSLGRALLRHLGKVLSSLPFYLGFFLAAVTPRRQALHDILAGCLVVRD